MHGTDGEVRGERRKTRIRWVVAESGQWMTFSEKAPYAVLGQGTLLFIEGIYRSDFPEVILSKMPVLITSRVLPVPHFTAGWAQAAGDPACSPGSPIKSSCPREHRHALLVLHWVGLWSSKNGASEGVARCVHTCVCARSLLCLSSDLLCEYAIRVGVFHFASLPLLLHGFKIEVRLGIDFVFQVVTKNLNCAIKHRCYHVVPSLVSFCFLNLVCSWWHTHVCDSFVFFSICGFCCLLLYVQRNFTYSLSWCPASAAFSSFAASMMLKNMLKYVSKNLM